ncbi:MAG: type II secretion system F family protein [Acidobacteriia bacterium]|nr:type II secretion system F family protein [Terriglobia bacterium]
MNLLIIAAGIGLSIIFFALLLFVLRPSRQSELLAEVTSRGSRVEDLGLQPRRYSFESLIRPLASFRRLFGGSPKPEVVRRLVLAGYRKPSYADAFIGLKLFLPAAAGLAVAFFVKNSVITWFVVVVLAAFFAPDFWLSHAINKRREKIRLSLPDALDLLAICMEAGLGLDQAIVRVGHELHLSHPELSDELLQINLEQRVGKPRIEAWRNMADRVDLESVRSFVNMLVQTERFGTPLSRSLAVFSDALRTQRRQKAEELAAKTTIKLIFPLVFFIFPSIFIVILIPAIITLIQHFSTFGR